MFGWLSLVSPKALLYDRLLAYRSDIVRIISEPLSPSDIASREVLKGSQRTIFEQKWRMFKKRSLI
jgi:hypothetical protein